MEVDLHSSHPRLQTDFYQELYKKYPHAFRRRLEARDAGRRLFNNKPQVRFNDEVEVSDDAYRMNSWSMDESPPGRHLTNWDREVGHYFQHRSPTRDCITSLEPSDCSGSVLSVSQRLRLNSQNLNKLLNERSSPLRKYRQKELVQYDSGTDNEQTLQDYMIEKSKERSRNRKKQRIIIQRKLNGSENGTVISSRGNDLLSRRWMSKSASPTGRHRLQYSLPITTQSKPHRDNDLNIDDLLSDSDLKIDTLLEKISMKVVSPDSPPDSAIDVETPSVQSMVAMEMKNSKMSEKSVQENLLNEKSNGEGIESSPGSSASACGRKSTSRQIETENCESLNCYSRNEGERLVEMMTAVVGRLETPAGTSKTHSTQQINKVSYETSGKLTQETDVTSSVLKEIKENVSIVSTGLLQVCKAGDSMGYTNKSNQKCNDNNGVCESQQEYIESPVVSEQSSDSESQKTVQSNSKEFRSTSEHLDDGKVPLESHIVQRQKDLVKQSEKQENCGKCEISGKCGESDTEELQEQIMINYNADDEEDEKVAMDTGMVNNCRQKHKSKGELTICHES